MSVESAALSLQRGPGRVLAARRSAPLAIAAAGVVATAITVWIVSGSRTLVEPALDGILRGSFVASCAAVAAYTCWRLPNRRLGPLVAVLGFVYALTSLNALGGTLAYSLGRTTLTVWALIVVYLCLSFPGDHIAPRTQRFLFRGLALTEGLAWLAVLALAPRLPPGGPLATCSGQCPGNAFQFVAASARTAHALTTLANWIIVVAFATAAVAVLRRLPSTWRPTRRAIAPLLLALAALVGSAAAYLVSQAPLSAGSGNVLRALAAAGALAFPLGLLLEQIGSDALVARRVGRIAGRASTETMDPASLERLIADALGDPSLRLLLAVPDARGFVDARGRPAEVAHEPPESVSALVAPDGGMLAVLIHDPMLDIDPRIIEGFTAIALTMYEKLRLVDELRASRARIVASAGRERLRLERNLHDGAQQRLMGIQIKLRLAQRRATDDDLAEELEEIRKDASEAVEELRTLAHGLYPSALRDGGLADGFRSLAMRAAIPIRVNDEGIGRCAGEVEAAVYFCALEAVQNVTKHAGRGAQVTITLRRRQSGLQVSIEDDGRGMDTRATSEGMGVVSMRDRIGAVGGELEIASSPGRGTSIRATIPDAGSGPRQGEPDASGVDTPPRSG